MARQDTPALPPVADEHRSQSAEERDEAHAAVEILDVPAVARLLAVGRNTVYTLVARNTRSPRYWTRLIEKMRAAQDKVVPSTPDAPGETARPDAR